METDLPYEEEYAVANFSPYSFYHGWYFPRKMDYYFKKYVLFEGVSNEIKERWKQVYRYLLKKITYENDGKRVMLKSLVNTGKIKLILEMASSTMKAERRLFTTVCSGAIPAVSNRGAQRITATSRTCLVLRMTTSTLAGLILSIRLTHTIWIRMRNASTKAIQALPQRRMRLILTARQEKSEISWISGLMSST